MTTDNRPPFAPDRPGLYEMRCGKTIAIYSISGLLAYAARGSDTLHFYHGECLLHLKRQLQFDIIARAPDDQQWCLAQARALLAAVPGFVIVPVEPTEAMIEAGSSAFASATTGRPTTKAYKAMIKAAQERGS